MKSLKYSSNKTVMIIFIIGFYFNIDEPTALVQREGGPCAVIAPVQAFILKQLLLESDVITWKAIKAEKCDRLLVKAMIEIINQAADVQNPKYSVIHANDSNSFASNKETVDSKTTESTEITVNPAQHNEDSKINETQIAKQTSLESEVFHSQLRYINDIILYNNFYITITIICFYIILQ